MLVAEGSARAANSPRAHLARNQSTGVHTAQRRKRRRAGSDGVSGHRSLARHAKPSLRANEQEVGLYEENFNVSPEVAAENLAIQEAGSDVSTLLQEHLGTVYAGVWFDNHSGEFVVPRVESGSSVSVTQALNAVGLRGHFRFMPVGSSWLELEAAQEHIDLRLRDLAGKGLVATLLDPRRNAVIVRIAEDASRSLDQIVTDEARKSRINVIVEKVPLERAVFGNLSCEIIEHVCGSPLRGGVGIESETGNIGKFFEAACTSAFKAIGNVFANRFILTAGHCVRGQPATWYTADSDNADQVRQIGFEEEFNYPGGDWAKIKANGTYWDQPSWPSEVAFWGEGENYAIQAESSSYIGEWVCHSGISTASSCGAVTGVDEYAELANTHAVEYHLTEAVGPHLCAAEGDSGGPVFAGHTALGILSAGALELPKCENVILYMEITEATAQMGVHVATQTGAPPVAESEAATGIEKRQVIGQGYVDPNGLPTEYYFQYGTTAAYGSATVSWGAGASFGPFASVSGAIQGLRPNTTYHYRVVAGNSAGSSVGQDEVFTTPPAPPIVTPEGVGTRTTEGGLLRGSINPEGAGTHYHFEIGLTNAYGASLPSPDGDAGAGLAAVAISSAVKGLRPETTYHYRLVAASSEGTAAGPDQTFTTLAVTPSLNRTFGSVGAGNGQLNVPAGLAVDAEGNLWVADKENNRIEKFGQKGEYLMQFGTKGIGNGQLNSPSDIAIAPNGHLWVTDTGNDRVQQFTAAGVYVSKTGTSGIAAGQFMEPLGIAFTGSSFWVSDASHDRIEQFNAMGTFVREVHGVLGGSGPGEFNHPTGLASGREGELWVADTGNNRLEQFTSGGSFVSAIGSLGSGQGALNAPYDISVKPSGTLWVVDKSNSRVEQLSRSGEYLSQFGLPGSGAGQFKEAQGIAVGLGGSEYVSDSGNARIQKLSQPLAPEAVTRPATNVLGRTITLNGQVNPGALPTTYRFEYGTTAEYGLAIPAPDEGVGSGTETLNKSKVIEGLQAEATYHYRVVATNSEGATYGQDTVVNNIAVPTFAAAFASPGSSGGQVNHPVGGAVDSSGNLWVADRENNRVEEFNAKGEFLFQFGTKGSGNGQLNSPTDVAFTTNDGSIWVVDSGNDRIEKFTLAGAYVSQIGASGGGAGQFVEPFGVVVSEDHTWVSDLGGNRLEEFDSQNRFMTEIRNHGAGGENGEFNRPMGIAADADGQLWVADSGNNRIQKLNAKGEYISKFGRKMGAVQFSEPVGVDVRPSGNIVVVERGASRAQVLSPTGEYLTRFGEFGTGVGQLEEPQGVVSGPCGNEYLTDTGNSRLERWTRFSGPEVSTGAASTMIAGEAVLHGKVNPCGSSTTYRFEYGATTAYGSSAPVPSENVGAGSESIAKTKAIVGLAVGTYHFRIVATSGLGTSYGRDVTFKVH